MCMALRKALAQGRQNSDPKSQLKGGKTFSQKRGTGPPPRARPRCQ